MRNITLILLFVSLMFAGCGKNQETKTSTGKTDTSTTKVTKTENAPSKTETDSKGVQNKVNDIDGMIDNFEKVVNSYIEASAKLKKGPDAAATAELSKLSAKQIELVGKLELEKSGMSPKQLEKYTTLSVKLTEATK
jgi:hypothetical protein